MSLVNTKVIQDERQSIAYHNRHFKFILQGHRPDADWEFTIQPPNEFGFSDRFNQCLVKISYAHLSNRGDALRFGLGSQFQAVVGGAIQACESGVLLKSDLRTLNQQMAYDRGSQAGHSGVACVLNNKYGSTGVNGAFLNANTKCAVLHTRGFAAAAPAGIGANQNDYKVNAWEFKDDRPIEESGVLCGNPFSRPIKFSLRNVDNGVEPVRLTAEDNAGAVGCHGASLNLEVEVLMLPNPRAQ